MNFEGACHMEPVELDESSATPLYAQIMADIRSKIEEGIFPDGARIPSEEQLNELYGVSRITVRRAVKELVAEGCLEKRQGKGTFVRTHQKMLSRFTQNVDVDSFTEACKKNGYKAGARLLRCEKVSGLESEREFFGFGSEGKLLRIDRLRTAGKTPIMIEENYFPLDSFAYLADIDLKDASLYDVIMAHGCDMPHLSEPCSLTIETATAAMAPELDVPCGEPLFLYMGRYFDDDEKPIYYGKQHIVGSRFTFRI